MDRPTVNPPITDAFTLSWASATSVGARRSNQDRCGAVAGPEPLLVLSDGMGGHPGGAEAAAMAVDEVLERARRPEGVGELRVLVQAVSRTVRARGVADPRFEGLGATLVVAVLRGDGVAYAHAGDSRLYLLRGGRGRLLTPPHELTTVLVRERVLQEREAKDSPLRGRLTSYLGMEDPEVSVGWATVADGDRLVLVSDGALENGEERVLNALGTPDIEEAARRIACGAATDDNATALVAALRSRTAHVR